MSRSNRLAPATSSEPLRRVEAGPWLIELLPACGYDARYVASRPAIGFAFDSQRGLHAIGSDRVRPFQACPNGLAFVPAGCDVFSASASGGEYLRLSRSDDGPLGDNRAFSNHQDPQATQLAQRMRQALLRASLDDDWEFWALALLARLPDAALPGRPTRGALTDKRLRLLDEYLDAGLDSPLGVPAMASLLGLSEGYFMRAFREATGQSPHRYLIDRRLARARALLHSGNARLADIAQACGFSSEAHMATAFKQRLGISPGELRGRAS